MFLDDTDYAALDPQDMIQHIDALPDQFADAWASGGAQTLPADWTGFRQIVIAGMGGSAISGDLLAALIEPTAQIPVRVVRGYDLPPYLTGPETLLIALSFSGTTEETLSATQAAIARGVPVLAITTGGDLAPLAADAGGVVWPIDYSSQPRAALGWLYGLTLAAAAKLGLAPADIAAQIDESLALMRRMRDLLTVASPTSRNPGKRVAGQMMDRIPVIWASGLLLPVARRWKTQFNENAKTGAYYEDMPELNHNSVVGILAPGELIDRHKVQIVQLTSAEYDHPRVTIRHEATTMLLRQAGLICEVVKARGESRLAQQMNLIQFGDYVSYYLAASYGVDPTPIEPIMMLKEMLAKAE
jgi:glucose/mannose-6-phosphate isomerase